MPMTGQNRFLYKAGEKTVLSSQEKLNSVRSRSEGGYNMLFGSAAYNRDKKLVIETSAIMNTIQLYSLDGQIERTICIGKKPDNIHEIEKMSEAKVPVTFMSLRSYDQCFAVIYFGTTEFDFQMRGDTKPYILVFDLDGGLLSCLKVPERITAFDIDWKEKVVYGVDSGKEKLYKFALPG